jgi:hypothetical protein
LLTTLVTGGGGSGDSFAGGDSETSAALTPLNGFISGIEEAVRLFQQRIAGAEAGGGAAPQAAAAWRGILDLAYGGFSQTASALSAATQEPVRLGVHPFQAIDAVMRSGLKSADGTGGMDGVGFGLEEVLRSVQGALQHAGNSVNRCLDSVLSAPVNGRSVVPMSINKSALPHSDTSEPGLQEFQRSTATTVADQPQPDLLACERPWWQAELATAFVLGGFWHTLPWQEDGHKRRVSAAR